MIEIRWHGRGGQGAVTAAELFAHAAITQGKYAQALPSFGTERRGAPVLAYNRIDEKPIWVRSEVYKPNIVVVIDFGLTKTVNVLSGLTDGGWVIMNTSRRPEEVKAQLNSNAKFATIDARKIALEVIGVPIVNTVMIGALVKVTGAVEIEYVAEAIKERFGGRAGEANVNAVRRSMSEVAFEA